MFNKHKIQYLEERIRDLDAQDTWRAKQLIELRYDLNRLTKHLGLEFKDVNERQLVAVEKLDKFKKT